MAHLRQAWGTMLHEEISTFWEELPGTDPTPWSMYGPPFGKSLCRAWSSGPITLLPQAVLGLEPTASVSTVRGCATSSVACLSPGAA
ncbi:hypothetical protein [Actinomyces faecalis]|uniref:hypothetical protein n=1 Tax=Actinomyces faecalis TaxID=2722820 RepID=UPI001555F554|nr:hypothetical protein [Actinomyces faecalis]